MTTKIEMTQADFARHAGIAAPTVARYIKKGVLTLNEGGKLDMPAALHAFVEHLTGVAAGRGGEDQADLTKERALLTREQKIGQKMKNAIARGEYLLARDVERRWGNDYAAVMNAMIALPNDLALLLPHLSKHDLSTIDRAIRDALNRVANSLGADPA